MSVVQKVLAYDVAWSARLALPERRAWLRGAASVLAHTGDSPLWLAAAAMALTQDGGRTFGWRVVLATLTAGTLTTLLKWVFRRARPAGPRLGFYGALDHHAFPSGHAARAACVAVLLLPLLPAWAGILLLLWAPVVGLCRVALKVHFLSDIAAGLLVGAAVGSALALLNPRL